MQNSLFKLVRFILLSTTQRWVQADDRQSKVWFFWPDRVPLLFTEFWWKSPEARLLRIHIRMCIYIIYTLTCYLYILHCMCINIYIYRYVYVITSCYTSYEGNCPKQGSSLFTWGWPPLVLLQSSMCNFQACIFVAAGWASTSWCFDFAYFTMGLDSLHPSISHNF